eukprot:scaffold580_cov63-Phaeocystis_antarctica.AAC.5
MLDVLVTQDSLLSRPFLGQTPRALAPCPVASSGVVFYQACAPQASHRAPADAAGACRSRCAATPAV